MTANRAGSVASGSYVVRRLVPQDVPALVQIIDTVRREFGAGIAPAFGADEETCELQRMYLSAHHRRRGVGQLLLNQCLHQAKSLQFRRCYAETVSEMQAAIRFYQANGFQRLDAPLGSSGHEHNDCWLILDLGTGWEGDGTSLR